MFILLTPLINNIYCHDEEPVKTDNIKYNPFKTLVEDQDDIWQVKFGSGHLFPNPNEIQSNKFSFNFGVQYFYEINFSAKKNLALAIGLGYNFQQLKMNGIFIDEIFESSDITTDLSNPRLNVHDLNIPIEFRIKLNSELKIYTGYNFTFPLINNLEYEKEGENKKDKNIAPIESFQCGPSIRIGFKDFFLFARYNLSNTFSLTSSNSLNLFMFGISLGG